MRFVGFLNIDKARHERFNHLRSVDSSFEIKLWKIDDAIIFIWRIEHAIEKEVRDSVKSWNAPLTESMNMQTLSITIDGLEAMVDKVETNKKGILNETHHIH